MVPQSARGPARSARRRPAAPVRLRCEPFENRITPALFTPHVYTFSGLNNNGCVATADLNHDGYTDAILTNEGTDLAGNGDPYIHVLIARQGGGGFNSTKLNTGGTNTSFVAIGDLNGDGFPDAVVTNENAQGPGTFSLFMNDGAGDLSLVGTFLTSSYNPDCVAIADVTGDGIPDVIISSFGKDDGTGQNVIGQGITIFQQHTGANGKGNFDFSATGGINNPITSLTPSVAFIPTALTVADFNGDGIMDIAAVSPGVPPDFGQPYPDGDVYVFQGVGSGGFSAPLIFDSGGINPLSIKAADVNRDGKLDLVIANAGDPNSTMPEFNGTSVGVVLNVGNTGVGSTINFGVTNSLTSNSYGTFAVAVADFNLDGKPDIAAINYGSPLNPTPDAFVSLYMGNGSGGFTSGSPATYDLQWNSPGGQYLASGDFDGNGTPDIMAVGADDIVTVLTNSSPPPPAVSSVQINDGSIQRSEVKSLTVDFSTPVSFAGGAANAAAAFQLTHLTDGVNVGLAAAVSSDALGNTIVTLTFSGSEIDPISALNGGMPSLADGRYSLTILSASVTSAINGEVLNGDGPNGNYVSPPDTYGGNGLHLYRLFADVNGDGVVDASDVGLLKTTFNRNSSDPLYIWYLDADNSGAVDAQDVGQFKLRFNHNVY
jgi:hypothetical protein